MGDEQYHDGRVWSECAASAVENKRKGRAKNRGEHDSPKGAPHHPSGSNSKLPITFWLGSNRLWSVKPNTLDSDAA